MARQIPINNLVQDALKNHKSYYSWLCQESGIGGPLAQMFFETDFRWKEDIPDDENRAKDAVALREQYAIFILIGEETELISTEQWHDIDRIKKSILGPACVFEVLVCLARNLDEMLNLEEKKDVGKYFHQLMENGKFDLYDEEDYDFDTEKVKNYWEKHMNCILDRTYSADGTGSLFPFHGKIVDGNIPDQRKKSLWDQANDWVDIKLEGIYE